MIVYDTKVVFVAIVRARGRQTPEIEMYNFKWVHNDVCTTRKGEFMRFVGGTNLAKGDNGRRVRDEDLMKNITQHRGREVAEAHVPHHQSGIIPNGGEKSLR